MRWRRGKRSRLECKRGEVEEGNLKGSLEEREQERRSERKG